MGTTASRKLLCLVQRGFIERAIAASGHQIDALVYELYGLKKTGTPTVGAGDA